MNRRHQLRQRRKVQWRRHDVISMTEVSYVSLSPAAPRLAPIQKKIWSLDLLILAKPRSCCHYDLWEARSKVWGLTVILRALTFGGCCKTQCRANTRRHHMSVFFPPRELKAASLRWKCWTWLQYLYTKNLSVCWNMGYRYLLSTFVTFLIPPKKKKKHKKPRVYTMILYEFFFTSFKVLGITILGLVNALKNNSLHNSTGGKTEGWGWEYMVLPASFPLV